MSSDFAHNLDLISLQLSRELVAVGGGGLDGCGGW